MNGRQCNVLIAAQTCVSVCVGGEGQLVMPAPPEADYTEDNRKILSCLGSSCC